MKRTVIVISLIVLSLCCFVAFLQREANININAMNQVQQRASDIIPIDYVELFKNNQELKFKQTIVSKIREPIVDAAYKNNMLIMYKLGAIDDKPIDKIIDEVMEKRHISYNDVFWEDKDYNLFFRSEKPAPLSKIRLTLFGNDTQILEKSDSVAYYFSDLKNFSISTHGIEPQDIFWADPNEGSKQTEILFIKRNKYLYLYLLNNMKTATTISPYMLYNCVIKK
jgi:hypothetical protein